MKEISSQTGGGSGSQNSMKVHMGLGDATVIDSIKIIWPSGNIQFSNNHSVADCFTIYEEVGSLIKGKAYIDGNSNCAFDSGELPLPNQEIIITPIGKKVYTDENGEYELYLKPGEYSIEALSNLDYTTNSPSQSMTVTQGVNNIDNDFCYTSSCEEHDLSIDIAIAALRRGFADDLFISVKNNGGGTAENVTFGLVIPTGVNVNSSSIDWDDKIEDTLFWNVASIKPQEEFNLTLRDSVTLALEVGDLTTHHGFTRTFEQSCNSSDTINFIQEIVGAIDPNDKSIVYPEGRNRNYLISDEDITYKIRFENIGTYYASRVIVIDTLESKINPNSIHSVMCSHEYDLEINHNVLKFTFNDIRLPAKQDDSIRCNGFIQFKVKLKSVVPFETRLVNTAHIKFDFEDWIMTNETSSIILEKHPINTFNNINASLYPNPVTDELVIEIFELSKADNYFSNPLISSISVLDTKGKLISEIKGVNKASSTLDLEYLSRGIYIIKIESYDNNTLFKKVIKN